MSPICPICNGETDGFASYPTADGGRIHTACVDTTGTATGPWPVREPATPAVPGRPVLGYLANDAGAKAWRKGA